MCATLALSATLPPPPAGAWRPVAKTLLVAGIFLCGGLSLRSDDLTRGIRNWKPVLLVQAFGFVATPLMCLALRPFLPPHLFLGFLILGALPTTISSCVALTAGAGGNQASAIVNACLGNFLGVFLTPLWILVAAEGAMQIMEPGPVLLKLSLTVLVPLLIGQALRRVPGCGPGRRARRHLGILSQLLLLGVIYLGFQNAFSAGGRIPARTLLTGVGLCLLVHPLWLWIPWRLSALPALHCDRGDRVAVLFCASQKTLALGLPLISLLFSDHPGFPLLSLPILIYHPLQLLTGAVLAPGLSRGHAPPPDA